jgi:hypothetical protein
LRPAAIKCAINREKSRLPKPIRLAGTQAPPKGIRTSSLKEIQELIWNKNRTTDLRSFNLTLAGKETIASRASAGIQA